MATEGITPVGWVEDSDIFEMVRELGSPGWYSIADLHTIYSVIVAGQHRTAAPKLTLSLALKDRGWRPITKMVKGKTQRGWFLTQGWIRRAAAEKKDGAQ